MHSLNWKTGNGELVIGGETVSSVATQFGTPLYLYDANIAIDRIRRVQQAFPSFRVLYSVKSNPNEAICSLMARHGLGAEIVSAGEFETARRAGFDLKNLAITGPGKPYEEIEAYVTAEARFIYVESRHELELVEEAAAKKDVSTPVVVRVNPVHVISGAHEKMGGIATQFGIPQENVVDVLKGVGGDHVRYIGVHAFAGSQVLDRSLLASHFTRVAVMSKEVASEVGFDLRIVNFGGGFGIPYDHGAQHLDIELLGGEIRDAIEQVFPDEAGRPTFCIELGRYLVGECGVFLTKVLDVKSIRGTTFVVVDSGINAFARPAMPWAMEHPCTIASRPSHQPTGTYRIAGPLCQPSDVLCHDVGLADPRPGDIIVFFNAGAYGYTMSPVLYHSRSIPAEVLYYEGEFYVTRDGLSTADILSTQSVPEQLRPR